MPRKLENKAAIVTGAGTGIAEAVAHKLAAEGAKVCVLGLPGDPVEDVAAAIVEQYGVDAFALSGDVADESHAASAIGEAVTRFGGLDILCNIAAVYPELAEAQDFSLESFDSLLHNNCRSAFVMAKFALPHLQRSRGCIVNTGSTAAALGEPSAVPYGGTKAFIEALTRGLAHEQAAHGVRVNCVAPGVINTGWLHAERGAPIDADLSKSLQDFNLIGRLGTPEEMANVYAFLASEEASYVTGATFVADGGMEITRGLAGQQAGESFRTTPDGELVLAHSLDGNLNKTNVNRL